MTNNLFLDDERWPPQDGRKWNIVRSFEEAVEWMEENGCPDYVSFDNDLGGEKEGWHVAQWMIDRDLDQEGKFIPIEFQWYAHTQNSIRRDDINNRLERYLEWKVGFSFIPI